MVNHTCHQAARLPLLCARRINMAAVSILWACGPEEDPAGAEPLCV